tara:strand:- start:4391 stop:5215 length:825 start_codon:yes stop_codon:yes gene_type:complete
VHIRGKTWEPNVLSIQETLTKIDSQNLSAIRFGDGEISLIQGSSLGFQKYDASLANAIQKVLKSEDDTLLICIPGIFGDISTFSSLGFWFEIHHTFRYSDIWKKLTSPEKTYGDAFFARPYFTFKDKSKVSKIYELIKNLWKNKEVVLIEGEKSRLGVGNDLFNGARSLERILCPAENAFSKEDEIVAKAIELPKDTLILLSLGPAAKVIGYELFKRGYRVIDIGHVDMEYEMFLRNSEEQIPVKYKYFNEINERDPEECEEPEYLSQIIAKVT